MNIRTPRGRVDEGPGFKPRPDPIPVRRTSAAKHMAIIVVAIVASLIIAAALLT